MSCLECPLCSFARLGEIGARAAIVHAGKAGQVMMLLGCQVEQKKYDDHWMSCYACQAFYIVKLASLLLVYITVIT